MIQDLRLHPRAADGCRHYKTAGDGKKSAHQGALSETHQNDILRGFPDFRSDRKRRQKKTSAEIHQQHQTEKGEVCPPPAPDVLGLPREQGKFHHYHYNQSESEHNGPGDTSDFQIYRRGYADCPSGHQGTAQKFYCTPLIHILISLRSPRASVFSRKVSDFIAPVQKNSAGQQPAEHYCRNIKKFPFDTIPN